VPAKKPQYSKTQVRKAGKFLREMWRLRLVDEPAALDHALTVLEDWRACHSYPLTKARAGLRARLTTRSVEGDVSQRLKRTGRIIPKLARFPSMQLDTMQDIAGCRAVVSSQADVRQIMQGWRVMDRLIRVDDYVSSPRASGYRAVHLILDYDGFPIEMQLRTTLQHDWAYTVETWGGRLGVDLKSGQGPAEALDLLTALSEAMAIDEAGQSVPQALLDKIKTLGTKFAAVTGGDA